MNDERREALAALDDAMDWKGILDWVQDTWKHDYGWHQCFPNADGGYDLRLSTGGWSENEEIIAALENTMFWVFFWEESRRGGHYKFDVRINAGKAEEET